MQVGLKLLKRAV